MPTYHRIPDYLGEFYSLEDSLEGVGEAKPGEFIESLGSHFRQ